MKLSTTCLEEPLSVPPQPAVQQAMEAIRAYFERHPSAADSERGIAQWWLPTMGMEASSEQVGQALEILARRGVVERAPMLGGGVIYRSTNRPATATKPGEPD